MAHSVCCIRLLYVESARTSAGSQANDTKSRTSNVVAWLHSCHITRLSSSGCTTAPMEELVPSRRFAVRKERQLLDVLSEPARRFVPDAERKELPCLQILLARMRLPQRGLSGSSTMPSVSIFLSGIKPIVAI